MNDLFFPSVDISSNGTKVYVLELNGDLHQFALNAPDVFKEMRANTGAVAGEMIMDIKNGSFTNAGGILSEGTHYTITNLPTSFTSSISVNTLGTIGTLTLSGNAASHANLNNLEVLIFFLQI
ncbi:hypothetical protein FNH22_27885 [Fulvivirga sp. M361]|uniref:hypothetical protein n=1 Tax=Fulvivirga sp. M361 TaxID=2594266 RepID=UPI00117ACC60|nr:hypothetical protein [Fulvivirga sp. M361]TRX49057.1 hypothetical protein FNH22_27885 [Fulvivirga sp. M361]